MPPNLDQELSKLQAKREIIFRRVQLCYDAGKTLDTKSTDVTNMTNFKIRYSRFKETSDEYRNISQQIVDVQQQLNPQTPPVYEYLESFEDLCDHIEYYATKNLTPPTNSNSTENVGNQQQRIHLPKIELMKFDGEDLTLWPMFYENFKHFVHIKSELSNAEKLQYLLSSLIGKALKTCGAIEPIPDNYPVIWKLLEDTYQDKKYLANLYIDRLFNFRLPSNSNQNQLQLFLEKFHTNVVALQRLKIKDLHDYILTHLAMTKLPLDVINSFELIRDKTVLPNYEELIEFIRSQSKTLKFDKPKSHVITGPSYSKNYKSFFIGNQKSSNKSFDNNNKTNKPNCIICNDTFHVVSQCNKFLKLSPNNRFKSAKEKGLCINCLNPYHKLANCPSQTSCNKCKGRHHSLLHFDQQSVNSNQPVASTSTNPPNVVECADAEVVHTLCSRQHRCTKNDSQPTMVFLATAVVYAIDICNHFKKIRLLLDSGSQSNFLTAKCCKQLGLNISKTNTCIQGLGSFMQNVIGYSRLSFCGQFQPKPKYSMDVFIINKITDKLPSVFVNNTILKCFNELPLADETFNHPGEIDGIIGADLMARLLKSERVVCESDGPVALNTTLGYVIMGKIPIISQADLSQTFCAFENCSDLANVLNKFWEIETVPTTSVLSRDDIECEAIYSSTYSRDNTGRYTVALPFKSPPDNLGNSYDIARRRFFSLERKLENNVELRVAYNKIMQDYLDRNHMTSVTNMDLAESSYYIPHHAIFKESSSTPIRIVFDASAKSDSSLSLNDLLYPGPKLQKDIVSLLLNFRLFPIAFTADIKQMFRQINLKSNHIQYQRVLWRFSPDEPLSIYELRVVCFGVKSSPYLALRTVQQLAKDEAHNYPLASTIVQNNFYVDDLVFSVEDNSKAEKIYKETVDLFKSGQFELVKWSSNSQNLMAKIPETLKASYPLDFDETFKVLGLIWHPSLDNFSFRLGDFKPYSKPTKRSVLSAVAQLFDPLGLISSVTMYAKLLIKDFWIHKLDWDETPPKDLESRWMLFCKELTILSDLQVPRHLFMCDNRTGMLVGFADSSEKGYAAVIYLRGVTNGHDITCAMVCSKSRVAPLKLLSIPRLELCAALLLTKLLNFVINTFQDRLTISKIYALSDSTVVLHWLNSSPHRWSTFVANRVAKIQHDLPNCEWRHVASHLNVADRVSRGLTPSQFMSTQRNWFSGPSWMLLDENEWPITKLQVKPDFNLEQKSISLVVVDLVKSPLYLVADRVSSYNRLINVIIYILRFAKLLPRNSTISLSDVSIAETNLIKSVQTFHFSAEIQALKLNKHISNNLRMLRPFLGADGVLRVGGRLSNAKIDYEHQHPILLPNNSRFVELLIENYHRRNLHVGVFLLSSLLRQRFWIISSRNLIRRIVRNCNFCFRSNPKPTFPLMADLPSPRVNQTKAFLHTGVDFAGPFRISISRYRGNRCQKAYLCLFVCLTTKAIHLELCSDLSTAVFMSALKRFLSRRGPVSVMYSDCGTNFIGAKSELKDLYELIQSAHYNDMFKDELLRNKITWKLNPPYSPHFGGIWEGNIRSCKSILLKVIGQQLLSYEELNTLLIQVEALMNSRPLYDISSDPSDPIALTPAHFLLSAPLTSLPSPDLQDLSLNMVTRKSLVDALLQSYWKRWHSEYLSTLQIRTKWNTPGNPVKIGMVVVINHDNLPPLQWPLGVIVEVFPGADGIIRVASVRTRTGLYRRPVVRLCPLPTQ